MVNNLRNNIINILIVFGIIILSAAISYVNCYSGKDGFISSEFLVNYLGIFLGVVITLITFIYGVVQPHLNTENYPTDLFTELRHDTMFVFWLFVMGILIMAFGDVDIPYIFLGSYYPIKVIVIDFIRNFMFLISLYTIYDVLSCMFSIVFYTG